MQLILRPPASILSPASWPDVGSFGSSMEHTATGVEQVHCVGAGSLLLWLLLQARPNELAKQATQGLGHPSQLPSVVMHGPLVLPTPTSVADFCSTSASDVEEEWRRCGVMMFLDDDNMKKTEWLMHIMRDVAAGRFGQLESDMLRHIDHWDRANKLELRPAADPVSVGAGALRGPVMLGADRSRSSPIGFYAAAAHPLITALAWPQA